MWIVISSVKRVFKTTVLAVMYSCPQQYCFNRRFYGKSTWEYTWKCVLLTERQIWISMTSWWAGWHVAKATIGGIILLLCKYVSRNSSNSDMSVLHGSFWFLLLTWLVSEIYLSVFSSFFGFPFWMGSEKTIKSKCLVKFLVLCFHILNIL